LKIVDLRLKIDLQSKIAMKAITLCLAGFFCTVCVLSAQAQATRQLVYQPGVSIASVLAPQDRRVEISKDAPLEGFFPGDIPPGDLIRAHALDAEAVALIRIEKKDSHLTQEGDWVRTTYQASTNEQLRTKGRVTLRPIKFELDGGTVQIHRASVTAVAEWEPPSIPTVPMTACTECP
jgi:hypothetical protein